MSFKEIHPALVEDGYAVGRQVLRDTVDEMGGFDGLFRAFREEPLETAQQFTFLLAVGVGPAERIRNQKVNNQISSDEANAIQLENQQRARDIGIPDIDIPAFLAAYRIARIAGLIEGE